MEKFKFYAPTKVYFGKDEEQRVGKILQEYHPKKVLIHYGGKSAIQSGLLDRVKKALDEENIAYCLCGGVVANPLLSKVNEGIQICKEEGVDFILAVGGGSVLDSSKGIAYGGIEGLHYSFFVIFQKNTVFISGCNALYALKCR